MDPRRQMNSEICSSRQIFDDLAAHISLFYSSNCSSASKSSPRKAILSWFSSLSLHQRQACLTVVDSDFVKILLQMLARIQTDGYCHFFILPDLPTRPRSSLPSLCHRQLDGLLSRVAASNESERLISGSVRLFGSQDGEPGAEYALDSMSVGEEILKDPEVFVKAMDELSGGEFLREPDVNFSQSTWVELEWLKAKGYYSMASFISNKLELALSMSWHEHNGRKKARAGRPKSKVSPSGVGANVFWRQKGCLDWWQELDAGLRKNVFQIFLHKGAKVLVKEIIQRRMSDVKDELASLWTRSKPVPCYNPISAFHRMSQLCCSLDLEFFLGSGTVTSSSKPSSLANLINSVLVLQEIVEKSLMLKTIECESEPLFFSKLNSVNDVSEFIFRRLRWFLVSLWREYIEVELTGNLMLNELVNTEGILAGDVSKIKKNGRTSKRRNSSKKPSKLSHENNANSVRNNENPKPNSSCPGNLNSSVLPTRKTSNDGTFVEGKSIPNALEPQLGMANTKKPKSGRKRSKSKASASSKAAESPNSNFTEADSIPRTEKKGVCNRKFPESTRVAPLPKRSAFETSVQGRSFHKIPLGLDSSPLEKRMATGANSTDAEGCSAVVSSCESKDSFDKLHRETTSKEECRESIGCEMVERAASKSKCKPFWSEDEFDKRNLKILADSRPRSTKNNSQRHSPSTGVLHLNSNPTEESLGSLDAYHQGKVTSSKASSHLVISPRALPMSFDWPLMGRGCSGVTGPVTQHFDAACSSKLQSIFRPSVSTHGVQTRSNENEWIHNRDNLDYDEFKSSSGLLEDSESYWVSEDESDLHTFYGRDYNQFFGGGVMYWNTSDYLSTSFSRAPSHSSEDSSWARHEADLNRAVDDMVGSISLSSAIDCPEEKAPCSEGANGDSHSDPQLRPIIIPNMSRKGSRSEFKVNLNCSSPSVTSTRRDFPRIKRPSSPVVLCVHRNPRPAMPSAGDSRKHRGFPVVRSGSSSPRSWSMRNFHHGEYASTGTHKCLDGGEIVWTSWKSSKRVGSPMNQPVPGSLVQDQLTVISHCDQEHPDVALPIRPTESSCSFRNEHLAFLHNLLHEEIDSFCKKVAAENLIRKPYINWAVKRVTKSLQVLWPRSRTSVFGSVATGLALPSSDVDLVICLPPVRNLEPIKEAGILEGRNGIKETCLQRAARYLANQDWVKNDSLKTIENTAIPLIMLVAEVPQEIIKSHNHDSFGPKGLFSPNIAQRLACSSSHVRSVRLDISFRSSTHTGLQTTELVRKLTEQFPASIPLSLVLKQFLADRNLDRSYSGGLNSHCLVLLIIRFLQHERHLNRSNNQCLGSLFINFLYFFGNVFDPRQMHVSIHGSGVYMKRERGHSIDPIHIDDPLCPTNNVGKNCFRIHQCIKRRGKKG
ncbi:nucleotidyltransferase family protein isoform X3 [Wolffia australiana]